jgi:hypothetical protein
MTVELIDRFFLEIEVSSVYSLSRVETEKARRRLGDAVTARSPTRSSVMHFTRGFLCSFGLQWCAELMKATVSMGRIALALAVKLFR